MANCTFPHVNAHTPHTQQRYHLLPFGSLLFWVFLLCSPLLFFSVRQTAKNNRKLLNLIFILDVFQFHQLGCECEPAFSPQPIHIHIHRECGCNPDPTLLCQIAFAAPLCVYVIFVNRAKLKPTKANESGSGSSRSIAGGRTSIMCNYTLRSRFLCFCI